MALFLFPIISWSGPSLHFYFAQCDSIIIIIIIIIITCDSKGVRQSGVEALCKASTKFSWENVPMTMISGSTSFTQIYLFDLFVFISNNSSITPTVNQSLHP